MNRFKPSATVSTGEIGGLLASGVFVHFVTTVLAATETVGLLLGLGLYFTWYAWLFSIGVRAMRGNHIKGKGFDGAGHWFPRAILYLVWAGQSLGLVRGIAAGLGGS